MEPADASGAEHPERIVYFILDDAWPPGPFRRARPKPIRVSNSPVSAWSPERRSFGMTRARVPKDAHWQLVSMTEGAIVPWSLLDALAAPWFEEVFTLFARIATEADPEARAALETRLGDLFWTATPPHFASREAAEAFFARMRDAHASWPEPQRIFAAHWLRSADYNPVRALQLRDWTVRQAWEMPWRPPERREEQWHDNSAIVAGIEARLHAWFSSIEGTPPVEIDKKPASRGVRPRRVRWPEDLPALDAQTVNALLAAAEEDLVMLAKRTAEALDARKYGEEIVAAIGQDVLERGLVWLRLRRLLAQGKPQRIERFLQRWGAAALAHDMDVELDRGPDELPDVDADSVTNLHEALLLPLALRCRARTEGDDHLRAWAEFLEDETIDYAFGAPAEADRMADIAKALCIPNPRRALLSALGAEVKYFGSLRLEARLPQRLGPKSKKAALKRALAWIRAPAG
jgi:hypothetical protein